MGGIRENGGAASAAPENREQKTENRGAPAGRRRERWGGAAQIAQEIQEIQEIQERA